MNVRGANRLYTALLDTEEDAFLFRELIRLHPPPHALPLNNLRFNAASPDTLLAYLDAQGLGAAFHNLVKRHYA